MKILNCGLVLLVCSGCTTVNMSEDGRQPSAELAHISGDYRVTAGAPVTVVLRSVDDKPLKFWQHAADVADGTHRLLVDCHVLASEKLSRHVLNVTVFAGVRYYFEAEANPRQGCSEIKLVEHSN